MDATYTAKDILQMTVQAKDRGAELYLTLARNSENYHVGKLFTELAKDEHRHKMELEAWFEQLSGETQEEAYPGERALYLKALVDDNAFKCDKATKQALETTINEEEALQAGINFEKDFMLFLHDLRQHVAKDGASVIDSLIDEEINHIRDIVHIKEKLEKGK